MKFGTVKTQHALGAVLAHSLKAGTLRLKKGRLLGEEDIEALRASGVEEIIAARLEEGDVGEDAAAARIASALSADGIRPGEAATGRVNLFAKENGLFLADRPLVDRFNSIDPSITLATLADRSQVAAGDMVATIKIIPLAVSGHHLDLAAQAISVPGIVTMRAFSSARVGLVATKLPSLKPSVMDKTARLLQERLNASGSTIIAEERIAHTPEAVASAVAALKDSCDLIVAFGASAIVDAEDVIPSGIERAGGTVDHVGMPVDPGNLLVLGHVGAVPVIGAPGCARSPKENGFDWVLARLLSGETPTAEAIMGMGVGGLLKEIQSRPQPRLSGERPKNKDIQVDIVVLAAGRASRMGPESTEPAPHKLLAHFDGVPLIRKSCETAIAAGNGAVHVVLGYRGDEMKTALDGLAVNVIDNPDYEEGMAASLRCGVASVAKHAQGALIMLADMPAIAATHLSAMIGAFRRSGGSAIIRAVSGEVRGNPVILPRETFDALLRLEGDVGARQIISASGLPIIDVDIGDAALLDVDTREAVLDAGGVLKD
ncbi:MAG: molybdopterin-binding/glycosyltransferase family 2 protein [Pseudomonadota bacterium]